MVLQVMVAVLAVFAVPAWVLLVDLLYRAHADIAVIDLAKQVFLAQLLPLSLGAACATSLPNLAARLTAPLLRLSGIMIAGIALLVLWKVGPKLPSLGIAPWFACATLAASSIGLGHLVGGPAPDTPYNLGNHLRPAQSRHRAAGGLHQSSRCIRLPCGDHACACHHCPDCRLSRDRSAAWGHCWAGRSVASHHASAEGLAATPMGFAIVPGRADPP